MKRGLAIAALVVFGSAFFFGAWVLLRYDYDWSQMAPYAGNLFSGWLTTLAISIVALFLSVMIGALLTAGQLSEIGPARWVCRGFVELIRGTPLISQILIGYYLVANELQIDSRFGAGVVILSAFAGAYLSEIFRAGVESVGKSQWDSARAIGLTESQTYRHVVIPQAIRRVLPATAGQFANLIKDSSLLFVISVHEFTMQTREAIANSYTSIEGYLPLAVGYLILTLPISIVSRRLERKFGYEH